MKPPSENHDLTRWLDGEINESERASFEERLKHDPALAKEAQELRALSATLRSHLSAEIKMPHADFFNSQIQVRISQMEADEPRSKQSAALDWATLLHWLRQPWFAAAGAVALAVLSFVLFRPASDAPTKSTILSSYTPNTHVRAHTFHDEAADATVLMLDGLDAVPAKKKISGISAQRSEIETEFASTTLYDATGARLLMISRDAVGTPLIWTKAPRG
ncbi:MAG: anti-sigma factor family protein [Prosthecobacter sp.]|uniref:anti-sigma factor family protein n=1 Tax=Prosthecobacter sp. TaxID=1965333 RepID=UPI003902216C